MDLFKIAVVLAAVCSVAYSYAKGRDITQYSKTTTRPITPYTRWRSCIEKGFHPPSTDSAPSVSVDLVPAGTLNYSRSVSCFEPGENYDVIIRSSAHIYGVLVMPLKVGLRKYYDNLVSVGTMRSSRLNRELFMDSICSDQSVSHKFSFQFKRLTTLTIPWDAPNDTCSVEFIHHVVFSYSCWRLGRTVAYPVCNETRNETTTETMESTDSISNTGSEPGNNVTSPSASRGSTPPTKLPKATTAAATKLATEKHTNESSQSQSFD